MSIERKSKPLIDLFYKLDADLRKDDSGLNVRKYLLDYIATNSDWNDYVNFNEYKYCRNLVMANDMLELIVLCWLPKQASPIHNHAGQRCWAAILEGNIREQHYHFENTHSAFGEGPLEVIEDTVHEQGSVSFITDDIALHVLQPFNDTKGITLHVYSKPISECNLYCPITGKITHRKLGFYSIAGELQPNPCPVPTVNPILEMSCNATDLIDSKETLSSISAPTSMIH